MRRLLVANAPLIRVAAAAAGVTAILYLLVVSAVDALVEQSLIGQVDGRLENRLTQYQNDPRDLLRPQPINSDRTLLAPILAWVVDPSGRLAAWPVLPDGSTPALPRSQYGVSSPTTTTVNGEPFRVAGDVNYLGGTRPYRIIVGESIRIVDNTVIGMAVAELIAGIPLLLLVFFGALVIARRSVAPVERARRRQLAFTADASHELRTPLTVIEAESSLALSRDREPAAYQESLRRITVETARLRRIVEDLLFLARFDSEPDRALPRVADLAAVAEETARRFRAPAEQKGQTVAAQVAAGVFAPVPPDWADRLLGVLVDNACRYSPTGGRVRITVVADAGRPRVQVDDSGPGIAPADRARIFDRFARASSVAGGAGLGLAIADAVVRATGGRWEVGQSDLGGARFSVTWPPARGAAPGQPALGTPGAEPAG